MTPVDPNVAQSRASNPTVSAFVSASAGSGKTKVLTDRVLRLLLAGARPERILCLTFTRAAAAEMANRLNGRLSTWAVAEDDQLIDDLRKLETAMPDQDMRDRARRLFARVVDAPGGLRIQTIHAFCQSVLRRFPIEAGVSPNFEPLDATDAEELLAESRRSVMMRARSGDESTLAVALDSLVHRTEPDALQNQLVEISTQRGRFEDLRARYGGVDGLIAAVYDLLGLPREKDEATLLAEAVTSVACDHTGLAEATHILSGGSDTDRKRAAVISEWLAASPEDRTTGLERYRTAFLTTEGAIRKKLATQKATGAIPALEREADRLVTLEDDLRTCRTAAATASLLTLGAAVLDAYRTAKQARVALDYDDLILLTRDLLRRTGVAAWVLYKLDGGLDHILIDEAQDTNPDQWSVVEALTEEFFAGLGARDETRTVFAVGDAKQSIYSFQRADPAKFRQMQAHYSTRTHAIDHRFEQVSLAVSFRSTRAVLRLVDTVFSDEAARAGVSSGEIRHLPFRSTAGGLVELWPPEKPAEALEDEAWALPTATTVEDSPVVRLAHRVASTIADWIARGETLDARARPIRPGDILVLVRRRGVFMTALVRALKSLQVPVAGVDRMRLADQIAVMDLLALGRFLLLPEDDLTLACILKSPLIGLTDDDLTDLAPGRKGTLWAALIAARTNPRYDAIVDYLMALLDRTDFVPPYELFAGVLSEPCPGDARSGRRAIRARLGVDALDPLDEFLSLALAFQNRNPPSLQRFIAWFETGNAEIKRELGHGDGGQVRIMTVHGAKGLQAPIVFLPDTTGAALSPRQRPRLLWPDSDLPVPLYAPLKDFESRQFRDAQSRQIARQEEEFRRLLYVALTRAEDRLYVCGWLGKKTNDPAPGTWFSLVGRAMREIATPIDPVAGVDGKLRLVSPQLGDTQIETVTPPGTQERRDLPNWAIAPAPIDPDPPAPLTPSRPAQADPPVRSPIGPQSGTDRFRRGSVIHKLLQVLPDLPVNLRRKSASGYMALQSAFFDEPAQQEIVHVVMAVLEEPAFAPFFGPGSRAEVPVVGLIDGHILSGQIDRVAVLGDRVFIVDFKTNRPPPTTEAAVDTVYFSQMAAYRAALRRIYPRKVIECGLLWTDGPRMMILSPDRLDHASPEKIT